MADFILLMKISLISLLVNFLMIRIIRQWVSIILSIILDIMVNGIPGMQPRL